jgi:hypothetical protein
MPKATIYGTAYKWERDGQESRLRINGVPVATVKDSVHGFYFYAEDGAQSVNSALDGRYFHDHSQARGAAAEWLNSLYAREGTK